MGEIRNYVQYLPVRRVSYVRGDIIGKFARQFQDTFSRFDVIIFPLNEHALSYYNRRLRLRVIRQLRKEIKNSRKSYDDYELLIYTDITFVDDPSMDTYMVYCILELKEIENGEG